MSRGPTRSRGWVRPTVIEDLLDLLPLRRADNDELAAQNRDPFDALHDSYMASKPHVFTIVVDGKPAGVFGVGQGPTMHHGVPWMLGNEKLLKIPRDLVVIGREWINYLNGIYPHLENWVDARNDVSIRWLKAMDFVFDGQTYEVQDRFIFRRFTRDV